jgi:hypothetical protein
MNKETVSQWIGRKKNIVSDERYEPAKVNDFIALRRRLIKACQDNGVGLLLGCDAPQVFTFPDFQHTVNLSTWSWPALRRFRR